MFECRIFKKKFHFESVFHRLFFYHNRTQNNPEEKLFPESVVFLKSKIEKKAFKVCIIYSFGIEQNLEEQLFFSDCRKRAILNQRKQNTSL